MAVVGYVINTVLSFYLAVLFARMILSWVPVFDRTWQPRGVLLVLAEAICTLTDPPLRLLRRIIPPVRLGNATLDVGFMVLWLLVLVLMRVNAAIPY